MTRGKRTVALKSLDLRTREIEDAGTSGAMGIKFIGDWETKDLFLIQKHWGSMDYSILAVDGPDVHCSPDRSSIRLVADNSEGCQRLVAPDSSMARGVRLDT